MKTPPFTPKELRHYIAGNENNNISTWLQTTTNAHWRFIEVLHKIPAQTADQASELTFDEIEACFQDFCAGTLNEQRLIQCKSALAGNSASCKKLLYKVGQYDEMQITQQQISPAPSRDELLNMVGVPKSNVIGRIPSTVWYALSAAAVLLVVVLTQMQSPGLTLADIYHYENATPITYDGTLSRGDAAMPADSTGRRFLFEYNRGLSHYMAMEYREARQRWQPLLAKARQNAKTGAEIAQEFLFYYAVNQIALSLESSTLNAQQKRDLRNEALELLQESNAKPDAARYFRALALALNENGEQAINLLDSFPEDSHFSQKASDLRAFLLDAAN